MPLYQKIRGILFYPCLSVRLSVCTNLMWKLYIFPLLLNWFTYKAHIWYEIISHQYASAGTKVTSANVKVKYKGYISQKMAVSGAFVFHKHMLFFLFPKRFLFSSISYCINGSNRGWGNKDFAMSVCLSFAIFVDIKFNIDHNFWIVSDRAFIFPYFLVVRCSLVQRSRSSLKAKYQGHIKKKKKKLSLHGHFRVSQTQDINKRKIEMTGYLWLKIV